MSLVEVIKAKFSPSLVSEFATRLGESECNISKAIAIFLPSVLGHLVKNSQNKNLLDAISEINAEEVLENLPATLTDNSYLKTIKTILFEEQNYDLPQLAAERSGVDLSSSQSILNTVIATAVGTLSKTAQNQSLENNGITQLLTQQKALIQPIIPAGLSLEQLGLGDLITNSEVPSSPIEIIVEKTKKESPTTPSYTHEESIKNNGGFWNWLLPLLLLGLAAWYFWKLYEKQEIPEKTKTELKK